MNPRTRLHIGILLGLGFAPLASAQLSPPPPDAVAEGRRGGPTPRSGANREQTVIPQFDLDGDGFLAREERRAAREWLAEQRAGEGERRRGPGGRRGRGFGPGGGGNEAASPGERVSRDDVGHFPDADLYDLSVLRTFFLEFEEGEDWEEEMTAFYRTDVSVPAKLTVDGKTLENRVGVSFRGNSSFFTVAKGSKRSLNLSIDAIDGDQRLRGYKTLNLLSAHSDPSFLREALFGYIAGHYLPAAKTNFVRLVINGENWGVYVNSQQFNKDFLDDWFGSRKGHRWKVPAGGGGGTAALVYQGDAIEPYRRSYQLKGQVDDEEAAYRSLIHFCKVLGETPIEELSEALEPLLNIDGALWFLALDNAFQDGDGYLSRGSDFAMVEDAEGRFHLIPHDSNETFRAQGGGGPGFGAQGRGGPGFGGPPPRAGGRGDLPGPPDGPPPGGERPAPRPPRGDGEREASAPFGRDPLIGLDDLDRMPLVRLLQVPAFRATYLAHVRTLRDEWLDWESIEPLAERWRDLIRDAVARDTKKLYSTEAFEENLRVEVGGGRRGTPGLEEFVEGRRSFLLEHAALQGAVPTVRLTEAVRTAKPKQAVPLAALVEGDASAVRLRFRATRQGPFQSVAMVEEGKGRFAAQMPGHPAGTEVRYYLEAWGSDSAAVRFFPDPGEAAALTYQVAVERSSGVAPSDVVFNEVMAANETAIEDPHGDFDDWIELYNAGDTVFDLSQHSLSDKEAKLGKWTFPDGTTIAPKGFLLVWADENGGQEKGLHANFKLSKQGETLFLGNPAGDVTDILTFGPLEADQAYARQDDGQWQIQSGTPAQANGAP